MAEYIGNPTCGCPRCQGACTCAICDDGSSGDGSSSDNAPCCWRVVISSMDDSSCDDCDALNKTYYLSPVDDGSSYTPAGCSWYSDRACGDCDPSEIWLTAYQSGTDYVIEVTLGGHVWRKNYGTTKPNCCTLSNESLPHVTNSGDCDSSSATCTITARSDNAPCTTEPCTVTCTTCCVGDVGPEAFQVTISGVVARDPPECDNPYDPADCDVDFNGTWILPGQNCTWRYDGTETCMKGTNPHIRLTVTHVPATSKCRLWVQFAFDSIQDTPNCWDPKFMKEVDDSAPFDCVNLSNYDVPVYEYDPCCDVSGATCTVTALPSNP